MAGDPAVVAECQEHVSGLRETGVGELGANGWLIMEEAGHLAAGWTVCVKRGAG